MRARSNIRFCVCALCAAQLLLGCASSGSAPTQEEAIAGKTPFDSAGISFEGVLALTSCQTGFVVAGVPINDDLSAIEKAVIIKTVLDADERYTLSSALSDLDVTDEKSLELQKENLECVRAHLRERREINGMDPLIE